MKKKIQLIDKIFRQTFGSREDRILVRSPGRVNLIGEHTDYNEGFVLPAAIDKAVVFAIAPRQDLRCNFYAADLDDRYSCNLDSYWRSTKRWPNYLLGVFDQFLKEGRRVQGCDVIFGGDIPIGAGLSSSSAIETGLAFALNKLFDLRVDRLGLVKLAQKSENEFVGVQCGIMDQFINIFGEDKKVLKLDCRSLEYEYIPFERAELRIVLCDTKVRRSLASSEYNVRRKQCETVVNLLRRSDDRLKTLRDVTPDFLERHRNDLGPVLHRRSSYVVQENVRVLQACEDLKRDDIGSFGKRMYESHRGLRDDYEVSSPELDLLVELAADMGGVLGARMMGAGFGGCTINLVEESAVESFTELIPQRYRERNGRDMQVYVTSIESGTTKVIGEAIHV